MENNISINSAKYQKKRKLMKFKDGLENFLISSLPVFGFLIFGAFPMVLSLVMSFFEMHDTDFSNAVFIGLDNYKNMLNFNVYGEDFLYTFLTAGIFMISVPIGLAIPIFIAYQLNKIQFAKHFFRSVFFVPAVCAVTIIVIVFKMFIDENSGVFNQILTGLHFEPVKWLTGNPLTFNISMIIVSVWSGLGYATVLLQAAFAGVDESYEEAAKIDGASSSQIFWKITFPAITPTLGYLVTMRLIDSLQQMSLYYQFGFGIASPPQWTEGLYAYNTPVVYIYRMIFANSYQFGYGIGSAAAWILAVVIFVVTRINFKLQEKWVSYDF